MPDVTPLLQPYIYWRRRALRRQDPAAVQRRQLATILRRARNTDFGRAHDLAAIASVEDFRKAIPIRTYEDFWRDWWRAPFPVHENITSPGRTPYFAVTSGTASGTTKYIPVTRAMIAANKKAALDTLVHHLGQYPNSRPLKGRAFMMGGSTDLIEEAPGVLSGDLSGIAMHTQSAWMRPFAWPPEETALLADWEEKLRRFARDGFERDIAIWTGVPSWMLILLARMREAAPERKPFPNLELLVHGGVAWDLYRDRFAPFLAQTGAATREVYPASEGFFAIQDRGEGEGLRLNLDHGVFFEFVPVAELGAPHPTRHWVGDLETGVNYALVVTSCAGLFAYLVGDTVRFVDRHPPRLLITGRISYMLSAFGEHLIGSEIEDAVNQAAAAQGLRIIEYSVGPALDSTDGGGADGGRGRHIWLVEAEGDADAAALAREIDRRLAAGNDDYRAHRAADAGMAAPEVRLQAPGAFERWMAAHGKSGGQHKTPRVIADAAKFRAMLAEFDSPG